MKKYIVEIDIDLAGESLSTYIEIEAENQDQAYKKAYNLVHNTIDIRIEKKPIESI